jgi:hypothetical protein
MQSQQQAYSSGLGYFTVLGYHTFKEIGPLSLTDAASYGKKTSALSKSMGITVDKVKDPRFGMVNAYHESVLDEIILKKKIGESKNDKLLK